MKDLIGLFLVGWSIGSPEPLRMIWYHHHHLVSIVAVEGSPCREHTRP